MITIWKNETVKRSVTGIILGFCFFGTYIHSTTLFSLLLIAILLIVLIFEWPLLVNFNNKRNWIITFFYPTISFGILIYLNQTYHSTDFFLPLYPFLVAWVGDTSGYLIGKPFGKYKVCPSISPKKTWEGIAGGFIGTLLFNFLYLPTIKSYSMVKLIQTPWILILLSLSIYIVGFSGDLFVSVLKRLKGLKDTGSLLPGHGGLLDRFDSVLFVAIFMIILIWIF